MKSSEAGHITDIQGTELRLEKSMKKTALLLILVIAVLILTACGSEKHEPTVVVETPAPAAETQKPVQTPEVQTAAPEPVETAQPDDTGFDDEKYQIALGLVGEVVEELYKAIGYPEFQDYGPSCLGKPGSEDGQLEYEGFSVFTLVEDGVETIVEVLKDDEF